MEPFRPSRSLINSKFEGYKLDLASQEDDVTHYPLEYRPTQATISGKSFFSFQEVQSRITHNHLSVYHEAGRAAYVDASSRVVLIDIDQVTARPSIRVLYELPTSIYSDNSPPRNHEYPSAAFLTPTLLFVSDGHGLMYALQIRESQASEMLGTFALSDVAARLPFRIHSTHRISPTTAVVILSSLCYQARDEPKSQQTTGKPAQVDFDISAVKIELLTLQSSKDIHQLNVLWSRRGQEAPIYTAYHESSKSFLLIGGSNYLPIGCAHPPSYEPGPDEIAPIPRAGEVLETDAPKPPPYSWTQTSDSVTVAIPLPSSTPKHTIKVTFTPETLTVLIENEIPTSLALPHYSAKRLWDGISPSTSYWTWDREAEHTFGLLTLYLDKQHEGTRWSQVFASVGVSITPEPSAEDSEVPETLDPSELWHIRESLEKYTTALREGDDASGLGLGKGMPSLAEGEIDIEVDESVGKSACITWVGEDGLAPRWEGQFENVPFQLLSVPLPGSGTSDLSLVVKNNFDGTVYALGFQETEGRRVLQWTHTSTFSALAFVLASKQDTRFTYHMPNAVFAFESGIQGRGGNVYVYRAAPINEKWAKQAILKVGGALLGVGAVKAGGKSVLICLTEEELVTIRNL